MQIELNSTFSKQVSNAKTTHQVANKMPKIGKFEENKLKIN
jgi:hypothetical protein